MQRHVHTSDTSRLLPFPYALFRITIYYLYKRTRPGKSFHSLQITRENHVDRGIMGVEPLSNEIFRNERSSSDPLLLPSSSCNQIQYFSRSRNRFVMRRGIKLTGFAQINLLQEWAYYNRWRISEETHVVCLTTAKNSSHVTFSH